MRQETIAGMVLCIMGLAMLFISPDTWWTIAEKWKTKDGSGPSRNYAVLLRVLGAVFFGTGMVLTWTSL